MTALSTIRSPRAKSRGAGTQSAVATPGVGRAQPRAVWRRHLSWLGVAAAAILLLFHRDAAGMVEIWWTSSTYNHCLLIVPILAWLVWRRAPELAELVPQSWPPGLAIVGAAALLWLAGAAGDINLFRHAGLIVMLQGAVIACLGKTVARPLAFPLFYALFLIPAGDEIVPQMQILTAHMATFLLGLSGVPAYLDGIFIATPIGLFEVAEACAGVKFLVAMVAYGALVAHLCFKSWRRRAVFMAAAILVPILANGVRAWGTIQAAHVFGIEKAIGFDHIVYGGVFFAVVMAVVTGAAWPFFDRRADDAAFDPARLQPVAPGPDPAATPARMAAAAIALAALVWSAAGLYRGGWGL